MNKQLLLLIGSPRSGTTLLNAMVGCHPDVAMINEDFGHAVFNIVSKPVVGNKLCVPNQIELEEKGSYVQRQLQKNNLRQYRPQADLSIRDYLDRGARIIATIRHPDPVVDSIAKRGKQPRKLAVYRWVRAIQIIQTLREQYADRIHIVAFPHLVSQTETVMRHVSAFIGIDYDPVMLEGYAHTPIYSNKGIDSSKASEIDLPVGDVIASSEPEAVSAYHSLMEMVTKGLPLPDQQTT